MPIHETTLAWASTLRFPADMGGYVYMMSNRRDGVLYLGVTNDLARRAFEHREGVVDGFTRRYGLAKLVWAEWHDDIRAAVQRERTMKCRLGLERLSHAWDDWTIDAAV